MAVEAYDVAIVGGGLLGGAMSRFIEAESARLKMICIEQGNESPARRNASHVYLTHPNAYRSSATYMGMGGRGNHWGGVSFPFSRSRLTSGMGVTGFGAQKIINSYSDVAAFARIESPKVPPILEAAIGRDVSGVPRLVEDSNDPWNPGRAISGNVDVLTGTTVSHVEPDSRSNKIFAHTGEYVKARTIVLCAGTIANFDIIARSLAIEFDLSLSGNVSDHVVFGYVTTVDASSSCLAPNVDVFLPPTEGEDYYILIQTRPSNVYHGFLEVDVWGFIDIPLSSGPSVNFDRNSNVTVIEGGDPESVESRCLSLAANCRDVVHRLSTIFLPGHRLPAPGANLSLNVRYDQARYLSMYNWANYCHLPGTVQHEYGSLCSAGSLDNDLSARKIDLLSCWITGGAQFRALGPLNPTFTYLAAAYGLRHVAASFA